MNERAIEARGNDIEEAIQRGLRKLGLGRTDVIIDIIDEGRKGLLGLGSREAVVRLTPLPQAEVQPAVTEMAEETPERVAEPTPDVEEGPGPEPVAEPIPDVEEEPAPEPAVEAATEPTEPEVQQVEEEPADEEVEAPLAEAAPALPKEEPLPQAPESAEAEAEETRYPADVDEDEELEEVLHEILSTLMEKMGFSEAEITVRYTEPDDKTGRVMTVAEINDGNELNSLIGAHGEILSDLQYVARLMAGHALKRRANFLIDVNGYRRKRKEALTKLAERMAAKAVRRGEPVTLEAMNAYDRRIIHIALRDHDEVYTNSVGEGADRRVRVYLQE